METSQVTVLINGKQVQVPAGATILEAAARVGGPVPLLCHGKHLLPAETCRLCLVEVDGQERSLAACSTPVTEGMVVRTNTAQLNAERRAILRLALDDHYGDCLAPCSQRCPANIDIQGYIALTARGQYLEACRLIRQTNPLPLTCGRVCPHPCESVCRRNRVDEPVNINHLKRFVSDIAYQNVSRLNPPRAPLTGHRVAIIGGGPAGLTAAYFLALKGHRPTIFEAMPQLGGMLRYGIPEYRLPKVILDREIEAILQMGIEVRTNLTWGRDLFLKDVFDQGFGAIFLGIGAGVNIHMAIENEEVAGVYPGTIFLRQVAQGQIPDLGARVAIIGGGNTAMDCARTSLRLGAAQVSVLYRRTRKEMPAQAIEVDEAEHEGVEFQFLVAPLKVLAIDNQVVGLKIIRMELGEPDASGRARPRPVPGSETDFALDNIIVAIGQGPDPVFLAKDTQAWNLKVNKWGNIEVDQETGQTNIPKVFAAGDLTSGPATVVEAVGSGRRAAEAMDRFLRGKATAPARNFIFSKGRLDEVAAVNFENRFLSPRQKMPSLSANDRFHNFKEVELGLSEEQARMEAVRCLACGCQARDECRLRQVAEQLGMRETIVKTVPPQPWGPGGDHPRIVIDDQKCVVCRKCERACADYHGRQAISIDIDRTQDLAVYRHHRTRINDRCDHCGLCLAQCPTGALGVKTPWPQAGPFPLVWRDSVCNLCALGCGLKVGCIGDHAVAINGRDSAPNYSHLCRYGRFDLLSWRDDPGRIRQPLVRHNDRLEAAGWDEALATAVAGIKKIKHSRGGAVLAGLTFGRASLESLYMFNKLGRLGLETNNLDYVHPAVQVIGSHHLESVTDGESSSFRFEEIEQYDLLFLIGPGLTDRLRLLPSAINRLRRQGGKVIVAADQDAALHSQADLVQAPDPGTAYDLVTDLIMERQENSPAGRLWAAAGSRLILVSELGLTPGNMSAFQGMIYLADQRQVPWGLVPAVTGRSAAKLTGVHPDFVANGHWRDSNQHQKLERQWNRFVPTTPGLSADDLISAIADDRILGLIINGGILSDEQVSPRLISAFRELDFLVATDYFPGPLLEAATVVWPQFFCLEMEGTFISADGRWRPMEAAVPPPGDWWPDWRLWGRLMEELGGPAAPGHLAAIQAEMSAFSYGQAR